ncbi:MAG: serine/threonine-protein kinase [Polyangiaceae bacterium]
MPRKPRPITESWQHNLTGRAFVDAFFDCASAARSLGLVPSGASEHVSFSLSFEELTGTLEEVRASLQPADIDSLQSASFRLSARHPGPGAQRGVVTLTASPKQQSLLIEVQHPPDINVALDFVATVRARFPRAAEGTPAQDATGVPEATTADASAAAAANAGVLRLNPGLQIDHYRLMRRLGAGYSGEVWQAEVVSAPLGVAVVPGQIVAMKQYFPFVLTRSSDSLRIQREFRVASELRHDNLVNVYDLVLSPSRPFGSFLIMEYVAGEPLKSRIPQDGFTWQECVTVGLQLAAALAELHSYGALHRDVKPANIIVLPGETLALKLLDLGIVSMIGEQGLTEASVFLGSKHTSAPEQLFGDEIDERADVYALGGTLYQCYRGRPLYDEEGPVTAIVRAMLEKPRSATPKENAEPDEIEFVRFIDRCMSLDPAKRPSSAHQCVEVLQAFATN